MGILDLVQEAQLHREVYIALLNSALQEPGSKRKLAREAAVTPQYLSYLLHPEADDFQTARIPSAKIAEKLANALPLEYEQREQLLHHMSFAREATVRSTQTLRVELFRRPIEDVLRELRDADREANFASDPQIFKARYLVIRDTCKILLSHPVLYTYALKTVEVHLLLHNAQCILNRTGDALYHAKLAHAVMDNLSRNDYRGQDKERFDFYNMEVWRAEARAYSDLRLYREAYEKCAQAEESEVMRYQSEASHSHLYRDKLQALCRKPRFVLSEAEGLVERVRTLCDRSSNTLAPRWLFMANQYLARAYLNYQNLKKAKRLLNELSSQMASVPHLGPLHQTMFLKTYARLCWQAGDSAEWEYFLKRALRQAVDAGLAHQISDIKQTYGQALTPLLADISRPPQNV